MSKMRFQMFLDESQKEMLEKVRKEQKIPLAELVRNAIDKFLAEWKEKEEKPIKDDITERLLAIGGSCKGGPKDLADKHDTYLYGVTKK